MANKWQVMITNDDQSLLGYGDTFQDALIMLEANVNNIISDCRSGLITAADGEDWLIATSLIHSDLPNELKELSENAKLQAEIEKLKQDIELLKNSEEFWHGMYYMEGQRD